MGETTALHLQATDIPGLVVLHLPVHADARGWFKENWQREKMTALGLPDFGPVQNNISFNAHRGATRGIHTEPWDKLVSVATGRVFAAWVDMRAGDSFGNTFHIEVDPGVVVYVPRGVGNSYQALEDGTAYTYLVNEHWRPGINYPALDLGDETISIPWPIPLAESEISEKDQRNPTLAEVVPIAPRRTLITGGGGQLGRALAAEFPDAEVLARDSLDIADPEAVAAWPWAEYDVVLNAAAYTNVDGAETEQGRIAAWATNASGPSHLAAAARAHRLTLVHFSSDYVFDGSQQEHTEDESFSPLGVYGVTKAAGDLAVASTPRHYILRTSWVVGEGKNFVRTMGELAAKVVSPAVVSDQFGRLTFTSELARATRHLLEHGADFGTYNVTNGGEIMSWADIARRVFELSGAQANSVSDTTTDAWAQGKSVAPRPRHSALSSDKLRRTGFVQSDALEDLTHYLR